MLSGLPDALPGNARTYLVLTFGSGLEGEDRFAVVRQQVDVDDDLLGRMRSR